MRFVGCLSRLERGPGVQDREVRGQAAGDQGVDFRQIGLALPTHQRRRDTHATDECVFGGIKRRAIGRCVTRACPQIIEHRAMQRRRRRKVGAQALRGAIVMPRRKRRQRSHHVPVREQMCAVAARHHVGEIAVEHRIEIGIFFVSCGVQHAEPDALRVRVREQLRDLGTGGVAVERNAFEAECIEECTQGRNVTLEFRPFGIASETIGEAVAGRIERDRGEIFREASCHRLGECAGLWRWMQQHHRRTLSCAAIVHLRAVGKRDETTLHSVDSCVETRMLH